MDYFGEFKFFCQPVLLFISIILFYHRVYGQQPVVQDIKTKILVPNLPSSHYQFWLKNHPLAFKEFEKICSQVPNIVDINDLKYFQSLHVNLSFENKLYLDDLNYGKTVLNKICSKKDIVMKSCWGYESSCEEIHVMPECNSSNLVQAEDKQKQKIIWFKQADFGYILERRTEMSRFCAPDKYSNDSIKSSLECTKYFRTCRGDNLYMRFNNIFTVGNSSTISDYDLPLIEKEDIGGWNCGLESKRIQEEGEQNGTLQSWFEELKNYKKLCLPQDTKLSELCDLTIEKQAFIIKLDNTNNMYNYFSNFLYLYATIHLNNKFSDDNEIIIWDTKLTKSIFDPMWSVFSRNRRRSIAEFEGKRICFKKFIFTLLPRINGGLYFNTQLIPGCSKSGLFKAFNKHILHKLNIPQRYNLNFHRRTKNKIIKVTILSRSTQHRRILNENELKLAINNKSTDYHVQLIDYSGISFLKQLEITQNTDILIGVHGAELTHTLFLSDWAALLEVRDCGDKCYHDLARLRGVSYFSSNNQELLKEIPVEGELDLRYMNKSNPVDKNKFSNYMIDANKFLATFELAVVDVKKTRLKYIKDLEVPGNSKILENESKGIQTNKMKAETDHTSNHHTEL